MNKSFIDTRIDSVNNSITLYGSNFNISTLLNLFYVLDVCNKHNIYNASIYLDDMDSIVVKVYKNNKQLDKNITIDLYKNNIRYTDSSYSHNRTLKWSSYTKRKFINRYNRLGQNNA